jgi:hypothetical protein
VQFLFAFQTLAMMSSAVHARDRMNVEPFLYAHAAAGAAGVWDWLRQWLRDLRTFGRDQSLKRLQLCFVKNGGRHQPSLMKS